MFEDFFSKKKPIQTNTKKQFVLIKYDNHSNHCRKRYIHKQTDIRGYEIKENSYKFFLSLSKSFFIFLEYKGKTNLNFQILI